MKRIKAFILIMLFVLSSNIVYGQIIQANNQTNYSIDNVSPFDETFYAVFGPPRMPLPNSFYNNSMWNYDWSRKHGFSQQKKELSLFGTAKEIKTHGKTVVYDAAMTALPGTSGSGGGDKITIEPDYISLSAGDKNIFIPIQYTGDKSVTPQSFSRREKEEIAKYVEKALSISGVTPSSVVIDADNNDFNIAVHKSKYTTEEMALNQLGEVIDEHDFSKNVKNTMLILSSEEREINSRGIKGIEVEKNVFNSLKNRVLNFCDEIDDEIDEFYQKT